MNKDHVAIKPSLDANWTFLVPSTSNTCSAEADEIIETCSKLFEAFEDFVVPVEATYNLQTFPADSLVPTSPNGSPDERIDSQEIVKENEEGIQFETLFEKYSTSSESAYYIPELRINRTKVMMYLESGDVYVDRENHSVFYKGNVPQDQVPTYDPLSFEVTHLADLDDVVSTNFVIVIRVRTKTDIWFENTDIGEVNRSRLQALLERIESNLPVESVRRETGWDIIGQMEEIY